MGDGTGLTEGKRFGGYEVLGFLRTAGGARVYRARQLSVNRLVTLVILPRQMAEKPSYRTRFERQLTAASKLRHDHILSAIDAGTIAGHMYLVAEYVGGRLLSEALADGEWFGVRRAARVALGIARALEHVNNVGLLHRNITPKAIVLGDANRVKLRGFSFARPHRQKAGETWFDSDAYSAEYQAPEWVSEKTVDIRADIYSLGCVLFHMLTGRPPFPGRNPITILESHVRDPLPDVHGLRDDVPEAMGHVLAKALAKDRGRRYATPAEMAADLEAVVAGRDVEPPAGPPRRRLFRRRRPS